MTPASKSQLRAARLFDVDIDTDRHAGDSYESAALLLAEAGCIPSGIPAGETWRSVAKMSDADLLAALPIQIDNEPVDGTGTYQ